MPELIFSLVTLIALASGWALCWQLVFGEFEGAWGNKKNRGTLAIAFVVFATVAYAIMPAS